MQGIETRRIAGTIANGYQCGSVSAWDVVGISYSVFVLVKNNFWMMLNNGGFSTDKTNILLRKLSFA